MLDETIATMEPSPTTVRTSQQQVNKELDQAAKNGKRKSSLTSNPDDTTTPASTSKRMRIEGS